MRSSKYILITGTSSGLGNALVHHLAGKGFGVIAGVRKVKDFALFKAPNIYPMLCDVSEFDSEVLVNSIASITDGYGLFALINNAGINYISPFEWADSGRERQLLEVNLLGPARLTRAVLPLLHHYVHVNHQKQKARIINIGSIGGVFGLPWESAYHASKFGLLGWSQSIRYELEPLHIDVCCFLPGGMKTKIFEKSQNQNSEVPLVRTSHHSYYSRNVKNMYKTMQDFEKSAAPAEKAAATIAKLLESQKMPLRKYFGKDAAFIRTLNWIGLIHVLKGQFVKK